VSSPSTPKRPRCAKPWYGTSTPSATCPNSSGYTTRRALDIAQPTGKGPALFPNLDEKYYEYNPYTADYNNEQMESLVTLYTYSSEGREGGVAQAQHRVRPTRRDLEEGHFSGDDTVFDYWPSEFGVAVAFAYDLDRL
jgi:hypothetical protein